MRARTNATSWLDKESRRSLGRFFQENRQMAGIRQIQIAHGIGKLSPQFISKFERGECLLPLPKMIAYSRLLKIRKEELFEVLIKEHRKSLERLFR